MPKSLTMKVVKVWKHIADNIDVAVIKSIENTNNILTNISPQDKSVIKTACLKSIEEFEYQPNKIRDIFWGTV
jgi:hypothetical protein